MNPAANIRSASKTAHTKPGTEFIVKDTRPTSNGSAEWHSQENMNARKARNAGGRAIAISLGIALFLLFAMSVLLSAGGN